MKLGKYEETLDELTWEEYRLIESFLEKIGVRTRITMAEAKGDTHIVSMQAENPYKYWIGIGSREKEIADKMMSRDALNAYKR